MALVNAIPAAFPVAQSAFAAWLDPLVAGRVFWLQAPEQVLVPCMVIHSRDGGGQSREYLGSRGWQGDITVRVFAATDTQAAVLASQVASAIPTTPTLVSGSTILCTMLRPIVQPPAKLVSVAGFVYQVIIS